MRSARQARSCCAIRTIPTDGAWRPLRSSRICAPMRGSNWSWWMSSSPIWRRGRLSLAPHLPQSRLVVLRSLSKSYGLGGLRLGFALAAPDIAASLRAALGPWPVSGPAIAIGTSALGDRAWLDAARERLGRDVDRLDALLTTGRSRPYRRHAAVPPRRERPRGGAVPAPRRGRYPRAPLRSSPRLAALRHPRQRGGVAAARGRARLTRFRRDQPIGQRRRRNPHCPAESRKCRALAGRRLLPSRRRGPGAEAC